MRHDSHNGVEQSIVSEVSTSTVNGERRRGQGGPGGKERLLGATKKGKDHSVFIFKEKEEIPRLPNELESSADFLG